MQAIIMAAGKGSRLSELTNGNPKPFIEIHGKKLIEYNLEALKKIGVKEIFLVAGYKEEAFAEMTAGIKNIKLVYNPFYELMNVIGSFFFGMNYLTDDFLYLHADTLCDPIIYKKMITSPADIVLPVDYSAWDAEAMKVRSENGKIIEMSKKMPLDIAEGEFIGMAFIRKKVIPKLREKTIEVLKEKRFAEYFESAIQKLIDEGEFDIQAVSTEDAFWTEIDFKKDYLDACARIPSYMISGEYEI